jgi:outer membrane protein TolC
LHENSETDAYLDSLTNDLEGANVFVSLRYEFPVPNNAAHGLAYQSNAQLRKRAIERDELKRRIQSEVATAISNLRKSHDAYTEARKAVQRFQSALNNEMKKFQLQMSTLLDVQQVEEQLTQAMLQQVEASRVFAQALLSVRLSTDTLVEFSKEEGRIQAADLISVPNIFLPM